MKKTLAIVCGVLMLGAVGVGLANGLKAAITGSWVGKDGAYTNATGSRLELTAVILSGSFNSSTDSYVLVTQNSQTYILAKDGCTNTLSWNGDGITLEKSGVLTFYVSSSATATNRYRIESK